MARSSLLLLLLTGLALGQQALAEEILRPRDKKDFEAELKALQDKYGMPVADGEPTGDAVIVVDSDSDNDHAPAPRRQPPSDAVVSEPTAEAATAAAAQPDASNVASNGSVAATAATAAGESDPAAAPAARSEERPLFPGTLLRPRSGGDAASPAEPVDPAATAATDAQAGSPPATEPANAAAATAVQPAAVQAGAAAFPGTLLQPRKPATQAEPATAPAAAALGEPAYPGTTLSPRGKPASDAQGAVVLQAPPTATPAASQTPSTPLFPGTTLAPRGPEAAARVLAEPAPAAGTGTLPTRRLSPDQGQATPDNEAGAALRIALLPVGRQQFRFREQVYDAESLEIYLRQLGQPIDSVVLLSEPGSSIELGHLIALGRLGRVLRVPTLYQQGGQLRALSVR